MSRVGKSSTRGQICRARVWVARGRAANAALRLVVTRALPQSSQLPRLSERAGVGRGSPNFPQRFTPTAERDTAVCWAGGPAATELFPAWCTRSRGCPPDRRRAPGAAPAGCHPEETVSVTLPETPSPASGASLNGAKTGVEATGRGRRGPENCRGGRRAPRLPLR